MSTVDAGQMIRACRTGRGLSLRALATLAGTSHATLAAYEQGRKVPSAETLRRVVLAAGYDLELVRGDGARHRIDISRRGEELEEVLALAEQFPVRHRRSLPDRRFGRP